jgi:hypothetical protein
MQSVGVFNSCAVLNNNGRYCLIDGGKPVDRHVEEAEQGVSIIKDSELRVLGALAARSPEATAPEGR